jgi:uncharacterized protein
MIQQDHTYNDRAHPDLPIYALNWEQRYFFYTPGLIALVENEEFNGLRDAVLKNDPSGLKEEAAGLYLHLIDIASKQKERYLSRRTKEYLPECLTISISNDCNLACDYCYTRSHKGSSVHPVVDLNVVEASAKLVAENCKQLGKPFSVVFHGGGEPTFHWNYFTGLYFLTRRLAGSMKIPFFSYISTNGFISREKAKWLSDHFSLIGVSIDGPPKIQHQNRKTLSGGQTSPLVIDAIKSIANRKTQVEVRSTITSGNMFSQNEIVEYFIKELSVRKIRFEPKYGGSDPEFKETDSDEFAKNFILAQKTASRLGGELQFSGVRLDEIHGVYCDVLRNNLRIGPDGISVNCFFSPLAVKDNITGKFDEVHNRFVLDENNIKNIVKKAFLAPLKCRNCFLEYHCSKGCPDFCWNDSTKMELVGFRCAVHRKIALSTILS